MFACGLVQLVNLHGQYSVQMKMLGGIMTIYKGHKKPRIRHLGLIHALFPTFLFFYCLVGGFLIVALLIRLVAEFICFVGEFVAEISCAIDRLSKYLFVKPRR